MTDVVLQRPLSVLIVEDMESHYRDVKSAVEQLGCPVEVAWAQDYESAREQIIGQYFSVVIADLVLDEADPAIVTQPDRWGGLMLIWDVVDLEIQKSRAVVVYTRFPDPDVERRALARYGVVDFLAKANAGPQQLADELRDILQERRYFGLGCEVVFSDELSWEELVRVCTRHQNQALSARMSAELARVELECLFRLTFAECRSLAIHPMALGASGTGLVRVEREFTDGSHGSTIVAKFGDVALIKREIEGWQNLRNYLGAERATEVVDSVQGLGLGVLTYRFLGIGADSLSTLSNYYGEASARDVADSLQRLFDETCGLWYEEGNRIPREAARLDDVYRQALGIDVDRLVKGYEFRFGRPSRNADVVSYAQLDRDLPDVVRMMKRDELRFLTDTWSCRTHGDLHLQNLLVSPEHGQCWLIDFGRSGVGHWARDFAILETSIRFQLLINSDYGGLFEFECLMVNTPTLGAPVDLSAISDPSTRKAALVIQRLRETAAQLIDPYPQDRAFAEYLVALVFASTKFLEFHRLLDRKWRKHHVMIATGVMIEKLMQDMVPADLIRLEPPAGD